MISLVWDNRKWKCFTNDNYTCNKYVKEQYIFRKKKITSKHRSLNCPPGCFQFITIFSPSSSVYLILSDNQYGHHYSSCNYCCHPVFLINGKFIISITWLIWYLHCLAFHKNTKNRPIWIPWSIFSGDFFFFIGEVLYNISIFFYFFLPIYSNQF